MCLNVRYVVVLNGKEAIHEAFIKRSSDFSDRTELYTNQVVLNIHTKGKVSLCSVLPVYLHCERKKTHQNVFLIYSLQNLTDCDEIWYMLS